VALLSFCTSRVFFHRICEEAPAFFMPLSFFPFLPRRNKKPKPQGIPSSGPAFPSFQRALTRLVSLIDRIRNFFGT
jgi:hypothetical protein